MTHRLGEVPTTRYLKKTHYTVPFLLLISSKTCFLYLAVTSLFTTNSLATSTAHYMMHRLGEVLTTRYLEKTHYTVPFSPLTSSKTCFAYVAVMSLFAINSLAVFTVYHMMR